MFRSVTSFVSIVSWALLVIAASPSPAEAQTQLYSGSEASGSVGNGGEKPYFFVGEEGDRIWLSASTTNSGVGAYFRALAEVFAQGDETTPVLSVLGNSRKGLTLPSSGTYTVIVRDSDRSGSGDYQIGLYWVTPVRKTGAAWLLRNREVTGAAGNAKHEFYKFFAREGDLLTASVSTTNSGVGAYFSASADVVNSDGSLLFTINSNGANTFVAPSTEYYNVAVRDANFSGSGNYSFQVTADDPACPFQVWLGGGDRNCVKIYLSAAYAFRGGEFSIAYPSSLGAPLSVTKGAGLPATAEVYLNGDLPLTGCAEDPEVDRAFIVGWINSLETDVALPAGTYTLFEVCFELDPGTLPGYMPLKFVSGCGGIPDAPLVNVVTNSSGASVAVCPANGEIRARPPVDFRRGDSNGDGVFDLSDAIIILTCLYFNVGCATCEDARDANDDGIVDQSDAVYLINWRFLDGPRPPAPFPGCGEDTTADELGDCVRNLCL